LYTTLFYDLLTILRHNILIITAEVFLYLQCLSAVILNVSAVDDLRLRRWLVPS